MQKKLKIIRLKNNCSSTIKKLLFEPEIIKRSKNIFELKKDLAKNNQISAEKD